MFIFRSNPLPQCLHNTYYSVLDIQKPVVKFIPQASFLLNTPVAIYCQAQAFPSPEYEWYKGGELIKNVIEPVLMLSAASWNDTDVYSCKISNIMGMKTSDEVLLPLWGMYCK